MAGLLFKDIYLHKKELIATFGFILMAMVIVMFSSLRNGTDEKTLMLSGGVQACIMLFGGFIQDMIHKADERRVWSTFISSTPLAAKGQVKSKYLFTLLISIVNISICFLADTVNCAINDTFSTFSITVLIFWLQLLFKAIELPFIIRFGEKRGNNIRAIILLSVLFIVVVYLLFGDLSVFMSEESVYTFLSKVAQGTALQNEMMWAAGVLPFAATALYILSYKLSCKFYRKGAETYER